MDQPQYALHFQLVHRDANQVASLQFARNGQVWNQRHAVAHRHKPLDGLDCGQFDAHIQRRAIALKRLNHFPAQRRGHIVRNEVLLAQIVDRHARGPRKWMISG